MGADTSVFSACSATEVTQVREEVMLKKVTILILAAIVAFMAIAAIFSLIGPSALAGDSITQERVVNLPNDSGKWFISIAGNRGDRRYDILLNWFDTSAKLNKFKVQVHFWKVDSNTPLYQRRFAPNTKVLPVVRVQKPDGTVVYQTSGVNIPTNALGLYSEIAKAVNTSQCPDGRCPIRPRPKPRPDPQPEPQPKPQPTPSPEPAPDQAPVVPDTVPDTAPDAPVIDKTADGIPTALIVAAVIACVMIGGAIGLVVQWKKTYNL